MKLTDYLEQLRSKMHDDHLEKLRLLDTVGARLFANDCEVMRKLEEIEQGQARRASDMRLLAERIVSRLAHIPQAEHVEHYVNGNPRAGLAPPPLPSELNAYGVYDEMMGAKH